MKWKKLDLRRLEGGCFVNSARPIPHLGRWTVMRKMETAMVMVMGVAVDWLVVLLDLLVVVLDQQMMEKGDGDGNEGAGGAVFFK